MKGLFKDILDYTVHFNDKVIDLLLHSTAMPEKSLQLLNHTINAHEIWNARIGGVPCNVKVWEMRPLDILKDVNSKNFINSLDIITTQDPACSISYTNSKGEKFENTIQDIFFHMINHSTYHRGQIATDCKAHGIDPLVTDYIFYKRD